MSTVEKWYEHCYRRNLVDMHIADWDDEFMSRFSPDEYFNNLKKAHTQAAMIYCQSHAGLCYWPTKVGHMHKAFKGKEDQMRRLMRMCKEDGMHVVGYYSLINNACEEDSHPEWRVQSEPGNLSIRQAGSRYGSLCPNNPDYREFIKAQIDEIAEYFRADGEILMDGVFYDMTFLPGYCHCPYCKAHYKDVTGRDDFPERNWEDPAWQEYELIRQDELADFAHFVTDYTRKVMPGVTVQHNYANAAGGTTIDQATTEKISEACDFVGGDLNRDLFQQSYFAKYYAGVSKNQPFEYMFARCNPSLIAHTVTKKVEELAARMMMTAANHGATLVIDAIDPVGTLDSRVYDRIGKAFEYEMPYEPYLHGTMLQDVGVYYSSTGRYNSRGMKFNTLNCSMNTAHTLIEENILFNVVSNAHTDSINSLKAVIAPALAGITDQNRQDLMNYVNQGGVLYFSGVEDKKLLQMMFGAKFVKYTHETEVYFAPTQLGQPIFGEFTEQYPIPMRMSLPIVEGGDYEMLASMKLPYTDSTGPRFAAIHTNPPGILTNFPGMVTKQLGKGRVIWSAAPLEFQEGRAHRELLARLIRYYVPEFTLNTDAPRQVETIVFEDKNELLISTVDTLCDDELLPVRTFTLKLKCPKAPKEVIRLAGKDTQDTTVPFTYEDGRVCFKAENLVMFDMYRVIF